MSPATSPPNPPPEHFHTALPLPVLSVSWVPRPQHRATQLLEDAQSKPRFACRRPCRQNQELCLQGSHLPFCFYNISCSPIVASFSAAGSTKAQLIPPVGANLTLNIQFHPKQTISKQQKPVFHSNLANPSCGRIFILSEMACPALPTNVNEL